MVVPGLVGTGSSWAQSSVACAPLEGMRTKFWDQFTNLGHDAKGWCSLIPGLCMLSHLFLSCFSAPHFSSSPSQGHLGTRLKLTFLLPMSELHSAMLHSSGGYLSQAGKSQLSRLTPTTLGCCLQHKPNPRADWHCQAWTLCLFLAVWQAERFCEPVRPSALAACGRDAVLFQQWQETAGLGCWLVSLHASWPHSAAMTEHRAYMHMYMHVCVYIRLYTYPLYIDTQWHRHAHGPKKMKPKLH